MIVKIPSILEVPEMDGYRELLELSGIVGEVCSDIFEGFPGI